MYISIYIDIDIYVHMSIYTGDMQKVADLEFYAIPGAVSKRLYMHTYIHDIHDICT